MEEAEAKTTQILAANSNLRDNLEELHKCDSSSSKHEIIEEDLFTYSEKVKVEKLPFEKEGETAEPLNHKSKRRKSCRQNRFQGNYDLNAPLKGNGIISEIGIAQTNLSTSSIQRHKQPSSSSTVQSRKKGRKIERIDDDDGHLIIKRNSMLSPRCKQLQFESHHL